MMADDGEGKPPSFISKIKDVNISEGQPAHFDCRVEPIGDGSMQIQWFHNDQPLCIGKIEKKMPLKIGLVYLDWIDY